MMTWGETLDDATAAWGADDRPPLPSPAGVPVIPGRAVTFALAQALAAAAMLGVVMGVSLAVGQPILIPSLAAATFIQVLTPAAPGARPWPILVGQMCGLVGGVVAVHVLAATGLPSFGIGHPLDAARGVAVVVAAALTVLGQRVLRAANPSGAALAATIALGDETATLAGVLRSLAGILLIALVGEISRLLLLRLRPATG